jgi:PIN domain nuclease of toxin-antitoxin system
MRLLLDTHILLWSAGWSFSESPKTRISRAAIDLIDDEDNEAFFSAASVWEVAIKYARGDTDFAVEPNVFRRSMAESGYTELTITGRHAAAVAGLAMIHKDPFDRLLIAQAIVEGITLLTADKTVATYPGPIRLV